MNNITKKLLLLFSLSFIILSSVLRASPVLLVGYPAQDPAIDTLRSGLFTPDNKSFSFMHRWFFMRNDFYKMGFVYDINIIDNHPNLKYKLWLQNQPSDLVVILPGLGSNYTSLSISAFAELFYLQGYSVAAISDVFNWEFSEAASSVLTPGYTPVDSADIYYALTKVLKHIEDTYKGRIEEKFLVGYSMGGLHTLFIADLEEKLGANKIGFSKFVALNPPVDLIYGAKVIDSYYALAGKWTPEEIDSAVKKTVNLANKINKNEIAADDKILLSPDEAKYIIGYQFHLSLTELIYSINTRENLGALKAQYSWFSRTSLYKEIDTFDFMSYIRKFVEKYYAEKLGLNMSLDELNFASSLYSIENTLKNNDRIRIINTPNDFLVSDEQRKWLEEKAGDKLTTLSHGGHLGYLKFPQFKELLIQKMKN